jgi:hypothetical protein
MPQQLSAAYAATPAGIWYPSRYTAAATFFDVSPAGQETNPTGLWWRADGLRLYYTGAASNRVWTVTCTTPWDLSTGSIGASSPVITGYGSARSVAFDPTGTWAFLSFSTGGYVTQHLLTTRWDVTTLTATPTNIYSTGSNNGGLWLHEDGRLMTVAANGSNLLRTVVMSRPFDLSSASAGTSISGYNMGGQFVADEGRRLFYTTVGSLASLYLSTPYVFTSGGNQAYDDRKLAIGSNNNNVFVRPDGRRIWIINSTIDAIIQYSID